MGISGVDGADGNDHRIGRVRLAGDKRLQGVDHRRCRNDGVAQRVAVGTMAALAVDADVDLVCTGKDRTVAHADGPGVQLCRNMQCSNGIDLVKIDIRVVQEQLRAFHDFFRRLDEEIDGAGELVLHLTQDLCGTHIDRTMDVMAAGVHDTGHFAAGRHARIFLNGQSVDVAAEHDGRAIAGFGALQFKEQSGLAYPLETVVSDVFLYIVFQQSAGVVLLQAQLRILVDMNTHPCDLRRDLFHFLSDIYHNIIPQSYG